jgi:hypothetical protein
MRLGTSRSTSHSAILAFWHPETPRLAREATLGLSQSLFPILRPYRSAPSAMVPDSGHFWHAWRAIEIESLLSLPSFIACSGRFPKKKKEKNTLETLLGQFGCARIRLSCPPFPTLSLASQVWML